MTTPQIQSLIDAASPSRGRSIAGAVARVIDEVHTSVIAIASVAADAGYIPEWLRRFEGDQVPFSSESERVGWALTALGLVEALVNVQPPDIARALEWFEGSASNNFCKWQDANAALQSVVDSQEASALLPYYLDTFGRTTRLDVIRDASLKQSREARKEIGSFYTPADLAAFMADAIVDERGVPGSIHFEAVWYDPACGSGVFLLAALRCALERGVADPVDFAIGHLFGTDISPQACDFTSFVLLHALAPYIGGKPVAVWLRLRSNIAAVDALSLGVDAERARQTLEKLFGPTAKPLRLICNPPYALASGAGVRIDRAHTTKALYLPFVELCWKLSGRPADASCIVVPLAVATNTTPDHRRFRAALTAAGGDWTMLFFDRQPHALFGEEAKTRATVAIRRPHPAPAQIRTSGLLKWTSRQRRQIFTEDRAVSLGAVPIARLIPKLGSETEANLYRKLVEYRLRRPDRPHVEKAAPDEIVGTALTNDVFLGGTAYNFLNVFRNYPDHLSWRGELSTSGIHKLRFAEETGAHVATALLASRVAFWLWHVECDGFHVPTSFVDDLPLLDLDFSASDRARLAELGIAIWDGLQKDILVSSNRSRLTFAFRPTHVHQLREAADSIIIGNLGADGATLNGLSDFEFRVVSIDGSRRMARSARSAEIKEKG